MKDLNLQQANDNLSVNFVAAAARISAITMRRLVTYLLVFASLTACGSPEAMRTRGGGPGADTGNRTRDVRMHEGSLPYWDTPRLIEAEHPPLDAANHAAEFSRR